MKASKLSAFIAGVLIVISAKLIRAMEVRLEWNGLVLLILVALFVIGWNQLWRPIGSHIGFLYGWPKNSEEWRSYRAVAERFVVCFVGIATTASAFTLWEI